MVMKTCLLFLLGFNTLFAIYHWVSARRGVYIAKVLEIPRSLMSSMNHLYKTIERSRIINIDLHQSHNG